MKPVIDDLPAVLASTLRALGVIGRDTKTTTIRFDDSDVEFVVEVALRRFPNGGSWSMFRCSCGRRCQKLRLFEGRHTCAHCICATGMRYRIEMVSHASKRAVLTAPKRIARLNSAVPARLHPRNGQMLDRRIPLEARLRRSLIVARQFALDEHKKMLDKMLKDK